MSANPASLYAFPATASDVFGSGTKQSPFIIDTGLGNSGVIVNLAPSGPAPYQASLTILDSNSPNGPFTLAIDPQASILNLSAVTPNKYLISSTQRYVTIQMVVGAGAWQVDWAGLPGQAIAQDGLTPYQGFTTGPITNGASGIGVRLGSLLVPSLGKAFDTRQLRLFVFNLTPANITQVTLTTEALSISGAPFIVLYTYPQTATNVITPNAVLEWVITPTIGVLDNMNVGITFDAGVTTGQVDVQVLLSSAASSPSPGATVGAGAVQGQARDLGSTGVNVKASPTTFYGLTIVNNQAAVAYIQAFNDIVFNTTLGTTPPFWEIGVAASSSLSVPFPSVGKRFSRALSLFSTTAEGGGTGSAAGVQVFYDYI